PLHVPVPDRGEDEQAEGQMLRRNTVAAYRPARMGGQCAEHQAEMLGLLRCRLLAPDTVPLQTEGGERRGLEADQFRHFHGEDRWGVYNAGSQVGVGERSAVFV